MKELYEEEICKCITQLKKDDNTITMKAILDDLKDLIVNSSSNTDEIIRDWTYRIKKCAKKLNTKIKNNNIKYWDNILSPQLSVNTISSHILSNDQLPLTSSTISSSSSLFTSTNTSSNTESSSSTSSSSEKNYKLNSAEKTRVINTYDSILETDMWRLSSGKFVEREMRKLAALSIFEHPVHSFILDPYDPIWRDFFNDEEINEIITFNQKPLPNFPSHLKFFLDNFKDCKTPKDFYISAYQSKFDPVEDIDEKWIQESIINFTNVINQNILSTDLSEADILNKLWNFVYKIFYKSTVTARLGEKISSSSSIKMNQQRSLEVVNERKRMATGRKVDILFECGSFELGCTEVGKNETVGFDDKYLNDGLKKVPYILKDMLSVFLNHNNKIKNDIYSIGLVIMGLKIQLVILDIPSGSICRLTKTDFFDFPRSFENLHSLMVPLFDIVYKAKTMMERNVQVLNHPIEKPVCIVNIKKPSILPSFIPMKRKYEKVNEKK